MDNREKNLWLELYLNFAGCASGATGHLVISKSHKLAQVKCAPMTELHIYQSLAVVAVPSRVARFEPPA
jgi:hypothetical protein